MDFTGTEQSGLKIHPESFAPSTREHSPRREEPVGPQGSPRDTGQDGSAGRPGGQRGLEPLGGGWYLSNLPHPQCVPCEVSITQGRQGLGVTEGRPSGSVLSA